MFRSHFFGTALLVTFVLPTPLVAQEFYTINEVVGYVNLEQTNIFNPGDTLTGTSLVTVFPPQGSEFTFYYYVRTRMLAFTQTTPVTDWVEDGAWVQPGQQAQLSPVASQYNVPNLNLSSDYTYEVQFRYILTVPGGPPGDHYTIDSTAFFFTY